MREIPLPDVQRIHTNTGSHIEPRLDQHWPTDQQLAWYTAVIAHDTGLDIHLSEAAVECNGRHQPGYYSITVTGGGTTTGSDYPRTWAYLNGVRAGAQAARQAAP